LGKYPWEVAAWEKALGIVPNIKLSPSAKVVPELKKKFD